jgi:site-specific recombinase XerD
MIEKLNGHSDIQQLDKRHSVDYLCSAPSGEPVLQLDGAIELFIKHLIGAGRKPETIKTYRIRFGLFQQHPGFAGSVPVSQFTPEDLDNWAASLTLREGGLSDSSRLGYIQAIKTLFAFCHRRGYIPRDPARDLVRPRINHTARNKVMAHQTLFALLDHAWKKARNGNPRDLAIMLLLADTGMRRKELVNIKINDLNLDQLEVHITEGKTGERLADYTEGTREVIKLWLQSRPDVPHDYLFTTHQNSFSEPGKQLSPDTVNSIMRRLASTAKIGGRHNPHSLRHLVGQWLTDRLGNLEIVRQKLGHRSITTTARFYAHQDISRVKAATALHSPTLSYRRDGNE